MSQNQLPLTKVELPEWAQDLLQPMRYKVLYGGRGGGKSWAVARLLLLLGAQRRLRIMCAREIQRSLRESVYQLLVDQIEQIGLTNFYKRMASEIRGVNGTRIFFSGLRDLTADQIKSYESVDICWVEEAHTVSQRSWDILLPTIRKRKSEIWITFNPDSDADPVYQRFVISPPPNAIVKKVNFYDNPWFPEPLERERLYWKENYPETYDNVWLGAPRPAIRGAYYVNELQAAFEEGRITSVPIESQEVHTAWDLGMSDLTVIWFFQVVGQEIHFIDYYESAGVGLEHYAKVLQSKKYVYGRHFAPHDIKVRELGTGVSRYARAKELGIFFKILPTNRMRVEDGIELVRSHFRKVWIDKERCARGLEALRHYRAELLDDGVGVVYNRPKHNWASHAADAFRYAILGATRYIGARRISPEEIRELFEKYAPPVGYGEINYVS